MSENKVYAGINPAVILDSFDIDEMNIISKLSGEWYITYGAETKQGKKSTYKYLLMKPTDLYTEMFNLDLEIAVVFSEYKPFEPRTFDAIDYIFETFNNLRIEKLCLIIISRDENVAYRIEDLVKDDR